MKAAPRHRRRSAFFGRVCRFGLWVGVPVLLAGGLYGAVLLSPSPLRQVALQYTADRMLDGTARLGLVVADVIPNPPRTQLIRDAEARGCIVLDGLGMLVSQGAIGIRHWTGIEPELQVMRRELEHIFGIKH